ncbi:ATP-binding protein [Aquihabitans sp. G128]|uniref:ATP-binding protein n=1 Tax=Aquihabitans sp. G128 TaxID=2849779 RepID=UPI001C2155F3|nr:ATP-binding protein [Aquihabitans sp. G128]QXC63317.1 ATP-binding protein [Aquihabitans sp. G128]
MSDRIELPPTAGSVAVARHWSAAQVREDLGDEVAATVALLVSELVSNVVLHARTPCELLLTRSPGRVRAEVHDGSDRLPGPTIQTDPLALSGRGMLLVDAMSDAHGSEPLSGGGKLVWFELAVPSASGAPVAP